MHERFSKRIVDALQTLTKDSAKGAAERTVHRLTGNLAACSSATAERLGSSRPSLQPTVP